MAKAVEHLGLALGHRGAAQPHSSLLTSDGIDLRLTHPPVTNASLVSDRALAISVFTCSHTTGDPVVVALVPNPLDAHDTCAAAMIT